MSKILNTNRINRSDLSFLEWSVYLSFKQMLEQGMAGRLCSLRFTWQSPQCIKMDRERFVFGLLGGMIEATESLGNAKLHSVHLEEACGGDVIFGLVQLDNRVVAEIDMNQALPPGAEQLCYLLVDCEQGRLTNRPLVGHQSAEGSLLIKDNLRQMVSFHDLPCGDVGSVSPRIKAALKKKLGGGA